MITVGLTAAGSGVGQAVLHALCYRRLELRVVGLEISPMSAGLYFADSTHLLPLVKFEKDYLERLLDICTQEGLDVLIPGSDTELEPLARNQQQFRERGCRVIVASPEVVQLCRDKYQIYAFCRDRGLPFIETYSLAEAQVNIDRLSFPVIAKPRRGSASVGVRLLYEPDDLTRIPPDADLIVQPYLPPKVQHSTKIPDKAEMGRLDQSNEISLQFYVGGTGEILGTFASVNYLKDGVPIEVVPSPDSPALPEAAAIVKALVAVGLRGPINLQGRLTPEGYRFFEVNPRFTGITGVRSALSYREVEAGIWDFYAEKTATARGCLSFRPGFVGLRYVEEILVPRERVERVAQEKPVSENLPSPLPARVLVTGVSGYLGANLLAALLKLPEIQEVRAGVRSAAATARLRAWCGDDPRLTQVIGELPFSPWALEGIDLVIHLAGVLQPAASEEIFRVNAEGTRRLVEAMRQAGTCRMLYLSSQAVYGTRGEIPRSEMWRPCPETAYGLSKWIGEQLCLNEGLETVVLRPSRIYGLGLGMRWEELPHKLALLAAQRKPLPVYGGGEQQLDLVHIQDLCAAIIKAADYLGRHPQPAIFNVGGGQSISVAGLASLCQAVAVAMGLPEPVIEHRDRDKPQRLKLGLDIRRARTHLDWAPAVSLENGLRDLLLRAINSLGGRPVGTGSVVINDIPPFSTAVGVPARVIKQRQGKIGRRICEE